MLSLGLNKPTLLHINQHLLIDNQYITQQHHQLQELQIQEPLL
jgi:hypothetical protein